MRSFLNTRVGRLDYHADGPLVESLESAFALQIFQMAANRAVPKKSFKLLVVDQTLALQALEALPSDRPPFAIRECLLEKIKIGERFHGVNAGGFQLIAQELVIKPALQMMHSGIQKTLAMKAHPKANRAQALPGRQRMA